MRDVRIAPTLNKIIQNSQFKKVSKAQKEDRFLRRRQIAFMINDYFRVTGAHDTVLDCADLFSVTLHDDNNLRNSIQDGMNFYFEEVDASELHARRRSVQSKC